MNTRLILGLALLYQVLASPPNARTQVYEKVFSFTDARAADIANSPNKGAEPRAGLVQDSDGSFYGTTTDGGESGFGTVFKLSPSGELVTLVEFTNNGTKNKGRVPQAGLVKGSDGSFYGTTASGGGFNAPLGYGTVFRMTSTGVLTTLVEFTGDGPTNKGSNPAADLIQGSDGCFYGTTVSGGSSGYGTVFRMTPAGFLTTLVEFTGDGIGNKGRNPYSSLVQGNDGNFYGATYRGGASDLGTVFKLTPAGVLTTLAEFTGNGATNKGSAPLDGLVQGSDGNFYGSTSSGGTSDLGTVFRMTPTGALTTLVEFTGDGPTNKGSLPIGLMQGGDGSFYGTTAGGGASSYGTVFKMTPAGTLTTLVQFSGYGTANIGLFPQAGLVQGGDGLFYGTTENGGASGQGTVFKMTGAGVLTTLVEFAGNGTTNKGSEPHAGLVQSSDGSFYGTTYQSGTSDLGTIFKMTPDGVVTTLVEFTGVGPINKGRSPESSLVRGSDGDFYGTTAYSFTEGPGRAGGNGTVFKMTPAGVLTTLVEFTGNGTNNKGSFPRAGLVQGNDGNFYGTTATGGAFGYNPGNFQYGYGTVFKMTPTGALTTLVEFTRNGTNNRGSFPQASLVQGSDGNFYGTTFGFWDALGGASDFGTVFKVTPAGVLTTLAEFTGNGTNNKGSFPQAGLAQGSDGNFYGTTGNGGASDLGTVFKVTPAGVLTTLVEFTGNGASNKGSSPLAGLVQAGDGNFYGTTSRGGASDLGTIFKMTPTGVLTTLIEFTVPEEGVPTAPMIRAADGNLYGTTRGPDGSIYRLIFPGAPQVDLAVVIKGDVSAVLQAKVNARGVSTAASLEYGTDGVSFPNTVPVASNLTGFQTKLVGTTLTGLAPGTIYYYRFRAVSSAGTTVSPVASFSTLAAATASTAPATEIQPTSARFNGTVNARNFDSTVVFEWGTDGNSFPNVVPAIPGTVGGASNVAVSAAVAGLQVGGTYFYRVKATNAAGTTVSGASSLVTLTAPYVTLGAVGGITATSVEVAGTVNARGTSTTAVFEYGTDSSNFPNTVAAEPANFAGVDETAVTATVSGLVQGTRYFFRLRATSAGGVAQTGTGSFSTLALPAATSLAASAVGQTFATLNATVNAQDLETTVVFDYGIESASLSSTVVAVPGSVAGSNTASASRTLSGLTLDTVYYYRVRATSSAGTSTGEVRSFRTGQSVISVQTGAATELTATSARLAGTVNTQGLPTTVAFEVGTTGDLVNAVSYAATPQSISEAAVVPVSVRLSGLSEGTPYFYRVTATNVDGTTVGSILSFSSEANLAPVAVTDTVFYAGQVVVDPLANDEDANNKSPVPKNQGLVLDPALVVQPNASLGVASVTSDNRISYNPQFNVLDDDSLTYRVVDPLGASADGQLRLIAFSKRSGLYGGRIVFVNGAGAREGVVAVQMGGGGAISTSFMNWVGDSFVLKGVFDQRGTFTRTLNSPTGAVLTLTLTLDADLPQIRGSFEERVDGDSTTGMINFTLAKNAGTGGLAESGLRTGFLSPPSAQAAVMADGFLRMTVGKESRRGARFAGRLPDGEPFLASAAAQGRSYALTKKIEQGGIFTGLVRAIDGSTGASGMMGDLFWKKRTSGRARFHRSGVETTLSLSGVAYPELTRSALLPIGLNSASPNARLRLSGGDLIGPYRDLLLSIVPGGVQIIGPDAAQSGTDLPIGNLRLDVDSANAAFNGRFIHPATGKPVIFDGAIRVPFDGEPGQGRGVFRGPGSAGTVRIEVN